ncbi:hypothetical protein JX266_013943 [Neoarthrinium moseri]|nr:hypothetical protein JX266_013943 [Neoarthrinium moseri]
MSDKRNDDHIVRLPDHLPRSKSGTEAASQFGHVPSSKPLSKLDNSPGAAIASYCLASISMTLINKYVVSGNSWNLHFFFLCIQSVVCSGAIILCKQLGVINGLAPFDTGKAKRWFPISVLLVAQIYTGNKALQVLSVPVFTIFKNLTIIVIAYGEVLWFGGSVTPLMLLSFGLMVLSSVVAAWADIQAAIGGGDLAETSASISTLNAGYAWMGLNVMAQASFVLGLRRRIKSMGFTDWDTMFYNNLLTIPVLAAGTILTEDWSRNNVASNFPAESRNAMVIGMIYSGVGAIGISYCTAWCIRTTSSTTYSMTGALNKLPLAISGLIFFHAPVTFGSVSAIFLGFVSGLVYTWGKIRQTEQAKMSLPTTNQPVLSASAQSNKDVA